MPTITPLPLDEVLEGDCVELMGRLPAACIDLVFADPPYNLQLTTDLWRPNSTRVEGVADDWDRFESVEAYDSFTRGWLAAARRVLKPDGTLWVIGTYHNIHRVGSILMDLGYWILNEVVWIKPNPMPQMRGVRFCNAHETMVWARPRRTAPRCTLNYRGMKAGNEDVQMRSDWEIPVCGGSERRRIEGRKAHSTQKPEALLHRVIASSSRRGDLVLDPFCGTGTTAAVAKRLGRRFITIDRDPGYVALARERVALERPPREGLEDAIWVDAPRRRVPFVSLVEAGVLPAGTQLRFRGADILATVREDGSLVAGGRRGSIHRLGAACLNAPACNGWRHWEYRDGDGQWRLIDELRPEPGE